MGVGVFFRHPSEVREARQTSGTFGHVGIQVFLWNKNVYGVSKNLYGTTKCDASVVVRGFGHCYECRRAEGYG